MMEDRGASPAGTPRAGHFVEELSVVSRTTASPGAARRAAQDDPRRWLGPTAFLDLEDTKLRLRSRSLTQLSKTDREKALAIYGFVKRIPFARPFKLGVRTPREVLDAGRGDALDKVGVLVAMLRMAGIPARIRFMEMRGEMLRGLISHMSAAARPVAEIWTGERWIATDTYIFDAAYMAAARQRLSQEGWECGYGIHQDGASIWNGVDDAYLGGDACAKEGLATGADSLFDDPLAFFSSPAFRATHPAMARTLHWNMMVPAMGKVIRDLRNEAVSGRPDTGRRKPS
jgi:hypothetical protein